MENQYQVTVVIPAHNAEDYLMPCLESIMAQTLKDIQIICVNDGSTDRTEALVRSCMEKDGRISIINQENQYAGAARNNGMKAALGKYLVFWDADDIFEPTALEELYTQMEKDQADVGVCDAVRFHSESGRILTDIKYLKEQFLPEQVPFSIRELPQYIFNFTTDVPWNKMYRRSFIEDQGLQFENRARANDHYFVLRAFALAGSITLVNKSLIRYRISSGTSLTSGLSSTPLCTYEALLHTKEELEERGIFQNAKVRQSFANRVLSSMIYAMEKQTGGEAFVTVYQTLKKKGFEKLLVSGHGEDYYYSQGGYEKYQKMMEAEPMDYLLAEYAKVSGKYADLNPRHKVLLERYTAMREKAVDFRKTRDYLQKELDYIHQTKWYRFVTYCANLKNKLTGKGRKS